MRRSSFGVAERSAALALVAAGGLIVSSASGAVLGHRWSEIDNSTDVNGNPTGLDDGVFNGTIWRTFDLFLEIDDPVITLDSGVTPAVDPNDGLGVNGGTEFFQFFVLGSPNNFPPASPAINNFPLVEFDSYVGFGDLAASEIFTAGSFTFDTTSLVATWAPLPGLGAIGPDENGELFVGRFTVSSDLGFGANEASEFFLGGELDVSFVNDDPETIQISNAFGTVIPGPGGLAVLGVVGAAGALRRRRRN